MSQALVLGAGIQGLFAAYELAAHKKHSVRVLSHAGFSKPCSLFSTATLCLRGVQAHDGDYQTQLVQSLNLWKQFHSENQLLGLEDCQFFHNPSQEKLERQAARFARLTKTPQGFLEQGLIVNPDVFIPALKTLLKHMGVQFIEELVSAVDTEGTVYGQSGQAYQASTVVSCLGAGGRLLGERPFAPTKIHEGHYLQWDGVGLEYFDNITQNQVIDCDGVNLIWLPDHRRILFGSVSTKQALEVPDFDGLYSHPALAEFYLPPLSEALALTGLRTKGARNKPRREFFTLNETQLVVLDGAHKNGYLLAPVLASLMGDN